MPSSPAYSVVCHEPARGAAKLFDTGAVLPVVLTGTPDSDTDADALELIKPVIAMLPLVVEDVKAVGVDAVVSTADSLSVLVVRSDGSDVAAGAEAGAPIVLTERVPVAPGAECVALNADHDATMASGMGATATDAARQRSTEPSSLM